MRKETCCRHIGYSFRLAARDLLCAPSHKEGFVTPAVEHWLERNFLDISSLKKEEHFLFNNTLNTFYLRLYHVRHNPLPPHGLLFPISSKRYFLCTIPKTRLCNTSCGTLAGTRLSRYKLIKSFQLAARYLLRAPSLKQGHWLVPDFPVISSLNFNSSFLKKKIFIFSSSRLIFFLTAVAAVPFAVGGKFSNYNYMAGWLT